MERLGLIDEYQLMVVRVILGTGKYRFKYVKGLNLKRLDLKVFWNGRVLLKYRPKECK